MSSLFQGLPLNGFPVHVIIFLRQLPLMTGDRMADPIQCSSPPPGPPATPSKFKNRSEQQVLKPFQENAMNLSSNPVSFSEKRAFPRVPFQTDVLVTALTPSLRSGSFEIPEKGLLAKSLDMSEGGLRLELPPNFSLEDFTVARFQLKNNEPKLILFLKRVWSRGNQAGFSFLSLTEPDQERIRRFVQSGTKRT